MLEKSATFWLSHELMHGWHLWLASPRLRVMAKLRKGLSVLMKHREARALRSWEGFIGARTHNRETIRRSLVFPCRTAATVPTLLFRAGGVPSNRYRGAWWRRGNWHRL